MPTGSCGDTDIINFPKTVEHCLKTAKVAPSRLKGFCLASWARQVPVYHEKNATSFRAMAEAKAVYGKLRG